MELKIKKEKVLEAANRCKDAKEVLKTIFPEAFEEEVESYENICEKLLLSSELSYFYTFTSEKVVRYFGDNPPKIGYFSMAISETQVQKLLAINKLMNVAKYVNDGWKADWKDDAKFINSKYCIRLDTHNQDKPYTYFYREAKTQEVLFKSKESAEKAIKILGEDTIKLALCADY